MAFVLYNRNNEIIMKTNVKGQSREDIVEFATDKNRELIYAGVPLIDRIEEVNFPNIREILGWCKLEESDSDFEFFGDWQDVPAATIVNPVDPAKSFKSSKDPIEENCLA